MLGVPIHSARHFHQLFVLEKPPVCLQFTRSWTTGSPCSLVFPSHPCCCVLLLPGHVELLALLAPSSSSAQPLSTVWLQRFSAGGQQEGDSTSGDRSCHHRVTKPSLLHLGPGLSAFQKPLKIPYFLQCCY